jgi:hypothetical protein
VCQDGSNLPQQSFWLMKHTELPKDGGPVVVDSLAGEPVFIVEREHGAQGKFNLATCRGEPAPCAQVPPSNNHLQNDRI